jgi:hypothetical protein
MLADWLELQCLVSARRQSSKADLLNSLEIADDDRNTRISFDPETNEQLDQAILEEPRTALIEGVFDELEFRQACLGDSYPFEIDPKYMVLRAAFAKGKPRPGQIAYTFCLLVTALREKMILGIDKLAAEELEVAKLFQVCACLAAGGYFGGSVSSFGFPRAEHNDFLPALKIAYARFGYGEAKTKGLSVVLCVRHNMLSERNMYAQTRQEDAKGQCRRASEGTAQDTAGTARSAGQRPDDRRSGSGRFPGIQESPDRARPGCRDESPFGVCGRRREA